ncbi:MAG: hypothetical protein K2O65_17320 [Lachnospiraceae bacterium]|nr:hypothetical protein [Lachnospiraceae bacterium]
MQHDVLHRIGKEYMPVGCYAAYDVTEYILSGWPEDNIFTTGSADACGNE